MSQWTHPICDECWARKNPDRVPVRLQHPDVERCCYCGRQTPSGILVREDPLAIKNHKLHEEGS